MTDALPISPATGKPMKGRPHKRLDICRVCNGSKSINGKPCAACKASGRRPVVKSTNKEKEKRIEQLATVIGSKPLHKHELRAFCAAEWNLCWRQADRYVTNAREFLIKQSNRPKEEFRSEAIAWCENIMRDPKASEFAKLRAFRESCQIRGLYAPTGIRVADEQGKPLQAVVAPVVNFIIPSNGREGSPDSACK